jgi:hypothetical protein
MFIIFTSGFIPRLPEMLEMLAGAAYLVLLWPPLASAWHPYYWYVRAHAAKLAET